MQEPLRTLLPELGSGETLQICINPNPAELTTTGKVGTLEEEQPKVGPGGVRRAGASESKDTEGE